MADASAPASELVIRPATDADLDALVELDWSSAVHHVGLDPAFYRLPDRAALAAFLRRRLADPRREVIVNVTHGLLLRRTIRR